MGKNSKDREKTNVMRVLEQKGIPYVPHAYPHGEEAVDGMTAAALIGASPGQVFKTLVARGASKTPYVFVIPVCAELDLRKAAKSVGEKSVAMIRADELLPLTGYVRGGCSPVGMKKHYRTVADSSALALETMLVSAGRIGSQVELSPAALLALIGADTAELTAAE